MFKGNARIVFRYPRIVAIVTSGQNTGIQKLKPTNEANPYLVVEANAYNGG
jgi:hypothetical protein